MWRINRFLFNYQTDVEKVLICFMRLQIWSLALLSPHYPFLPDIVPYDDRTSVTFILLLCTIFSIPICLSSSVLFCSVLFCSVLHIHPSLSFSLSTLYSSICIYISLSFSFLFPSLSLSPSLFLAQSSSLSLSLLPLSLSLIPSHPSPLSSSHLFTFHTYTIQLNKWTYTTTFCTYRHTVTSSLTRRVPSGWGRGKRG